MPDYSNANTDNSTLLCSIEKYAKQMNEWLALGLKPDK